MNNPHHHRYAVYYAPPVASDWWEAGSTWLGRCAATLQKRSQPLVHGVTHGLQVSLTQAPRRYGWHATLKAPFVLARGVSEAELRSALRQLAAQLQPTDLGPLQVQVLDDFMALVPMGINSNTSAINHIASTCVTELHPLTAPLDDAELARRRQVGLSSEQDALLLAWGYPFVHTHFRFHLSLTGSLSGQSESNIAALHAAAQEHFGHLPIPRLDHLTLFAEPSRGADFVVLEQFALGRR